MSLTSAEHALRLVGRQTGPLDQRRAPLLEAVQQEAADAVLRPHCPGHQGGALLPPEIAAALGTQVHSADVWLSTAHHDRVRREAEELAAQAWRARRAWLLGNGSTGGNLAWLLATLREGEPVVVGRDAHTSVLAGLVLSGARPVWVTPRLHPRLLLPLGVEPDDLAEALDRAGPAVRQVLLTSPGYAGTCADLPALVDVAAAAGAQVYVDQAWGAHLASAPAGAPTPVHSLDAGAAGCVVSVHKTGTSLSSGAVLLAGGAADDELISRIDRAVRMTQTTSPLMPLLASIDAARRQLALDGVQYAARTAHRARWLATRLRAIAGVQVLDHVALGLPPERVDAAKLVVDVGGLGITGWELEARLRRLGVPPEGADDRRVYAVLPDEGFADAVELALQTQAPRVVPVAPGTPVVPDASLQVWQECLRPAVQVLTPRQAHAARAHAVPLEAALGRVAAEPLVPYPPGVPVVLPGERIDAGALQVLRAVLAAGGHVHGCADPALGTVRVL